MQSLRKKLLLAVKSFSERCPEFFRPRGDQLNTCVSQCQDRVSASFGRRFTGSLKDGDTIFNKFSPRMTVRLMPQTGARFLSSCQLLNMELYRSNALAHPERCRPFSAVAQPVESSDSDGPTSVPEVASPIKFKRLDKTARHIMQILDKEAVEQVKTQREIPEIKPGYIVQLKVEVPKNKRRVSLLKGIVIAMRNAGLNATFRIRRLVAGVGVESVYPLYSPNIKEIKVMDKKKVRRAKLYYLRDKLNALKK